MRLLQATKKSWRDGKMGIGVNVNQSGRAMIKPIQSEFEYLSADAYQNLGIRTSIHGIAFQTWLPLPISQGHWNQVSKRSDGNPGHNTVYDVLKVIKDHAGVKGGPADVVMAFMNDVVVQLNDDLQHITRDEPGTGYNPGQNGDSRKSTLRHASEKAIEAYFQLFHLLACLAVDNPKIVTKANDKIKKFLGGQTSK